MVSGTDGLFCEINNNSYITVNINDTYICETNAKYPKLINQ